MSTHRGRRTTATERQARTITERQAGQQRTPSWHTNPRTASERQAASLLAEPEVDENGRD
jgi:hypothetical protein